MGTYRLANTVQTNTTHKIYTMVYYCLLHVSVMHIDHHQVNIAICCDWPTQRDNAVKVLSRKHRDLNIKTSNVHPCQQKSIGLKFSKSQTGSVVRYSCHHNSSRFTFPIFAHSCRFSVLHSLQSITPRIY